MTGACPDKRVRLWVLDEHRYGLLPVIRRVWSRRGVRVHAPYATTYKWGYLREALEVDGANDAQLLFTPAINQDIHALFLEQIASSDPDSLHVIIQDQAGFHPRAEDPRLPDNVRLLPLPPYCPVLNPVKRLRPVAQSPHRQPALRQSRAARGLSHRRGPLPDRPGAGLFTHPRLDAATNKRWRSTIKRQFLEDLGIF